MSRFFIVQQKILHLLSEDKLSAITDEALLFESLESSSWYNESRDVSSNSAGLGAEDGVGVLFWSKKKFVI